MIDDVLEYLAGFYGELSITTGTKHTYVGMDVEFPGDATVEMSMQLYLNEAIEMFPDELTKDVTTPATDYIFDVNHDCPKLPEDKRELFHKIVAKFLYVTRKGCPDIFVAISFLTSRVGCADNDDWKKLARLLKYIRCMIDMKLKLSAKSLTTSKWLVDASYGVRDECKSQAGVALTFGTGSFISKSRKNQRNAKSSTDAELMAASDTSSKIIWTKNFMDAKGYGTNPSILYQDNKSSILLEKNGRMSCGPNTKHINNRYFFVQDYVRTKEIDLQYCPKEKMVADFLTKPLQGSDFTTL